VFLAPVFLYSPEIELAELLLGWLLLCTRGMLVFVADSGRNWVRPNPAAKFPQVVAISSYYCQAQRQQQQQRQQQGHRAHADMRRGN
jgi:hypothetical protein